MADTTTLTTSTSLPWAFKLNGDRSAVEPYEITTQTFNATLNTKDTYLDRDIEINLKTKSGSFIITSTTTASAPAIEDASDSLTDTQLKARALTASVVTTAPTEGAFLALNTKTITATANVTATVTSSGYLKENEVSTSTINITVPEANTVFIPLKGTTINVGLTDDSKTDLCNYFTQYDKTPLDTDTEAIAIEATAKPASAGYIGANSVSTTTYWKIKPGAFATYEKPADVSSLKNYGETGQSVVLPSGGGLQITAGWYEAGYISLATLVPDAATLQALEGTTQSNKLADGFSAYDKDGKLISGTLKDFTTALGTAWQTYYKEIGSDNNDGFIGIIPANTYTNTRYAIKEADVSKTIDITGTITPTIVAITSKEDTNAINVTSAVSSDLMNKVPSEGYYVAIKTETVTASATAALTVTSSGWIGAGTITETDETAVTVKESAPYYLKLATGAITTTNAQLETLTIDNNGKNVSSTIDDAISTESTNYRITVTTTMSGTMPAVSYSTTAGYIGAETNQPILPAKELKGEKTVTICLKPASITASSSLTKTPTVTSSVTTIGFSTTDLDDAKIISDTRVDNDGYIYGFTFENTAENGTVTPNYSATTAGYIEKTKEAVNGVGLTVGVNVASPTITKYIKAGTANIKAALTSTTSTQYFTAVPDETENGSGIITATFDTFNINAGYFPTQTSSAYQTAYGKTQKYKIVTGKFTSDEVKLSTATWSDDGKTTTFATGTNNTAGIVYATSDPKVEGKFYREIVATTTINAKADLSNSVSVETAGWFDAGKKISITGSLNNEYTSSASIFIEVFNGAYTINNNTAN